VLHSLRLRLLLLTVIVSAVAVAAVALLSSRITSRQFDRYLTTDNEANLERYRAALARHYRERGSWAEVQTALEQVGAVAGKGLILVDAQRSVLAAAPPEMARASIEVTPQHRVSFELREARATGERGRFEERVEKGVLMNAPRVAITGARGETAGTLYVVPLGGGGAAQNNESEFVGAINRSLVLAGLLAGAAALLVTFALSRRILGPVEALTGAVRRMAGGDLAQRVRVQSRDEIGELARAFNAMADGLARAEQLRRNMVNDIAHELRTPLTNLRCQIEALQDGLAAPTPEVMASLHEEAMLLNRLVGDLQELALAEAGQLRLERGPVSVRDVITQVTGAFEAQAAGKGIALVSDVPRELPAIYADAERVGQMLRNLLANAVAHTPRGGSVSVGARAAGGQVEIVVADTGAGIEPEHLPNVFERFYRVDGSRARSTGGAGLGLAIVKQLAEAHGGGVRVESEVCGGSSFFVTLPTFGVGSSESSHR
jgi:signal transduction histidine kinase